ncbi:hypothetical protein M3225_18245 [Priestia aryabhattai]|uniref:hypothetical protein n=1 Tax=Priestia aryabhattai TaxID=412384 RepID=UPI0020419048|nr:hypothetical protein [Priestia aryabhattai]MCM3772400.1 hypothetical protein [Priestia aryabhattai]
MVYILIEQTIKDAVKGSFTTTIQRKEEDHLFQLGRGGLLLFLGCIGYSFLVTIIHVLGTNLKSIVKQADP